MHRLKFGFKFAVASALWIATGSVAAANLYGGGDTLSAPAFVGDAYNYLLPRPRLSRDSSIASPHVPFSFAGLYNGSGPTIPVFAHYHTTYPNDAVSYCQTGSGFGKKVFSGLGYSASGSCGDVSFADPLGFSAEPISGFNLPDFIAVEAPTSRAEYDSFSASLGADRVTITQIPVLATHIAIPFNDTAGSGPASLALTTAHLCRIFSAQITNWSDPWLGLPSPGPNRPIAIAYRDDENGSTFAFTSYLAAQCNGQFGIPAGFFRPDQSFVRAVSQGGFMPSYAATIVAGASDGAIVARIRNTVGALGYAGIGEVLSQGAMYATVNGMDPATIPYALSIAPANLLQGQLLDGSMISAVPYRPDVTTAARNCIKLMNPTSQLSTGYPIAGFTYISAYYAGNEGAKVIPIKNLMRMFYKSGTQDLRTPLPAGYAYLDNNVVFRATVLNAINNCVN